MRLTYIANACVLVEHNGVKVLCDPWLKDGIYYGSWYQWPPPKFKPADFADVDYIYISHIHPDHCDVEALKEFPKDKKILICEYEEPFLKRLLEKIGFTNITEVKNRGTVNLGDDFDIEVIAGDDCDTRTFGLSYRVEIPQPYTKTKQIDSAAVFKGGGKVIVNTNDVPLALFQTAIPYIRTKYGTIDLLLVSYAAAGPYPQAYEMSDNDKMRHAVKVAYSFISSTFEYIRRFKPLAYMPFAGGYLLGGKFAGLNNYKGVLEIDECIDDLAPGVKRCGIESEMVLLNTGENMDLADMSVSKRFYPTDFITRKAYIEHTLSKKQFTYENEPEHVGDLSEKMQGALERLMRKQKEFGYYSDWAVYVDIGQPQFYRVPFDGSGKIERCEESRVENAVIARLHPALMNQILDRKAHWNNAEVGSHITLSVKMRRNGPRTYEPMVHHLMSYFQN